MTLEGGIIRGLCAQARMDRFAKVDLRTENSQQGGIRNASSSLYRKVDSLYLYFFEVLSRQVESRN